MLDILDCTIRDGGYYNDWNFSDEFVQEYLELLPQIGIRYAEVGFRSVTSKSHIGPWAYTPESLLERFKVPENLSVGVMINFSEYVDLSEEALENIFTDSKLLKFVRIALHLEDLENLPQLVRFLKRRGLVVGVNLMQVSTRTNVEIEYFARCISQLNADWIYVADSLGALSTANSEEIIKLIRKNTGELRVGIHAHDNKGSAAANSLAAVNYGADLVDATLLGMGRGAGNTKTEDLICDLNFNGTNPVTSSSLGKLNQFLEKYMMPLRQQHAWGASLPYRLAANWSIHPTYVQELVADKTDPDAIISILDALSSKDSLKFDDKLIKPTESRFSFVTELKIGENLKSRTGSRIVIVGGGASGREHESELKKFIDDHDATLFLINDAWENYPTSNKVFRIAFNKLRIESYPELFLEAQNNLISSLQIPVIDSNERELTTVPTKLTPGHFAVELNRVDLPNNLSLTFALAVSQLIGSQEVYLAGIDGYATGDNRNSEIVETLTLFRAFGKTEILSLTPSQFPVGLLSPYWRG